MKIFFTILFWLSCAAALHAQPFTVTGTVVSASDNTPLEGASVFINNGSKGTLTAANGQFTLSDISYASFELVVSFVSYETLVVKVGADNINKKFLIKMSPKTGELQEVVVGGIIKDGWKKWGATFIKHFIGTSAIAQKCILQNPEALRFRHNKSTGVLTVTAGDKLIIKNAKLGYTINYQLENFEFDNARGMVSYVGYPYFESKSPKSKRQLENWKEERRKAYLGSIMHFMRSFYTNKVNEEGFDLTYLIRLYKKDTITRAIYDRLRRGITTDVDTSKFSIQFVKPGTFADPVVYISGKKHLPVDSIRMHDTITNQVLLYFNNDMQVLYKNELESAEYVNQQIPVRTKRYPEASIFYLMSRNAVVVEKNGLYYDPLNLFTENYWAFEKLAEMLPSDYELEQ